MRSRREDEEEDEEDDEAEEETTLDPPFRELHFDSPLMNYPFD
jgi:hypothetical protein